MRRARSTRQGQSLACGDDTSAHFAGKRFAVCLLPGKKWPVRPRSDDAALALL